MPVLVMTTGGTIGALPYEDPAHPPPDASMPPSAHDLVRDALTVPPFNAIATRCISLELRDSKLIDAAYRKNMAALVGAASETKILITHGTDRLLETADFLFREGDVDGALKTKTIILTGAMTPLANGMLSDGYLNMAFAFEQLRELVAGVYIVLCDYASSESASGDWKPRLYDYRPGRYVKFYAEDGRYNRLKRV